MRAPDNSQETECVLFVIRCPFSYIFCHVNSFMNEKKKFFIKQAWFVPLIFFCCILLYNPSLFFMPSTPVYMAFFPAGVFSFLALSFLLLKPDDSFPAVRDLNPYACSALSLFALIAFLQYVQHSEYRLFHLAQSLMWISIPFCVFVFHTVIRKMLFPFLGLFSIWQMIYCILRPFSGSWGITGNINFTAELLLLSFPFLIYYTYCYLTERKKFSKRVSMLILVPVVLFGGALFFKCNSRGAFLGLFCVTLLFLFLHLPDRWRRILFYISLLCLICGVLLFVRYGVDRFSALVANEDRPYFYMGTVRMIGDFPLLGVGGVSFENAFVRYKPLEYFFARYVADRTGHPHNQELYMLASYGIFAYSAWFFLLYGPVFLLLRRLWRRERVDFPVKICLFVFLCAAIHSQFDLVFYFFPTNVIMLMMLGIFWYEAFRRKREVIPALPRKAFAVISRLAGLLVLAMACLFAIRAIYSSWMTWRLTSVPMSRAERLALIQRIIAFAPDEYKQNYALLILAEKLNAPEVVLKVSDIMLGSHIPNYGHIHFARGTALYRLGRLPEAYEAYRQDAENYPLTVRPYLQMIAIVKRMGRNELRPALEAALKERLKLREINPRMLEAIRNDPFYDMRPWSIPKEYGGPGGEVVFPDGQRFNW